ncbi:hypothetical protein GOP47_0013735 [Adiantum capillus-veneris]|uniref:DEK-C domain-containing protein n=1 Tax=Adiantum capillus-veneris TaxID=13818 RepID=A0A9D4ZDP0_ADICA|nr:hypothetical protein GOP47_0013735 [Adiantum capillus-veneris]
MEVDTAEIPAEVNDNEAENREADPDSVKGRGKKAGKKRNRSELPSPTSDRPTRERKSVERLIVSPDKEIKEFRIPKGTGTALKDIPNIVFKLSKRRSGDEAVQALHKVLFGKTSKHAGKGNILKFSGFVWSGNEEKEKLKIKERLEKVVKEILYQIGDLLDLNLSKGSKKEEGVLKVFEFLESPHKTTNKLVEEKAKAKKGKKAKKKVVKGAKRGRSPAKSPKGKKSPKTKQARVEEDDDDVADSEDAAEEMEAAEDEKEEQSDDEYNEKKTSTRKRKRKSLEEQSMQESEDEEEKASPKKSKAQKEKRKSTPKAAKKEEKPKSKSKAAKVKEPSEKDLKAAISEILQNADFSTVTFTDVMKQLGDKFKVDLTHKKSRLKLLIQVEIARLVGEGDNEDEDSSAEGGDEEKLSMEGGDDEEKPSDEQKDHDEDDSKEGSKEDEEDGDGVAQDSDVRDDEDVKGEKSGDEVADEEMNSEEDKAEGAREEEDKEGEGASTDEGADKEEGPS